MNLSFVKVYWTSYYYNNLRTKVLKSLYCLPCLILVICLLSNQYNQYNYCIFCISSNAFDIQFVCSIIFEGAKLFQSIIVIVFSFSYFYWILWIVLRRSFRSLGCIFLSDVVAQIWLDPLRSFWGCWETFIRYVFFDKSTLSCLFWPLKGVFGL